MTDRAHIRSGQILAVFNGEKRRIQLENGDWVLCAPIGYENGNDKIVPASEITNDTSTGSDVIREDINWHIVGNDESVSRIINIRDMTAQEIADREEAAKDDVVDSLTNSYRDKALATMGWHIANGTVPPQATSSPTAWRTWLRSLM